MSRLAASTRSERAHKRACGVKRCRGEEEEEARECPVCLDNYERLGERTEACPFVCAHGLCRSCDRKMFVRWDDRCPCCRSDRRSDLPNPCSRGPRPEPAGGGGTIFFPLEGVTISMPSQMLSFLAFSQFEANRGTAMVTARGSEVSNEATLALLHASRAAGAELAVVNGEADGPDGNSVDPDSIVDHSIEAQQEAARILTHQVVGHLSNPAVVGMLSALVDPHISLTEFLRRRGTAWPA